MVKARIILQVDFKTCKTEFCFLLVSTERENKLPAYERVALRKRK